MPTRRRRASIRACLDSLPRAPKKARHSASLTVRLSYLACASIGRKSRGGGRLLLSTIEQAPGLLDNRGSLNQTPLLTLLQSKQAQRATGTLQGRNGGGAASPFFFFGAPFYSLRQGHRGG